VSASIATWRSASPSAARRERWPSEAVALAAVQGLLEHSGEQVVKREAGQLAGELTAQDEHRRRVRIERRRERQQSVD